MRTDGTRSTERWLVSSKLPRKGPGTHLDSFHFLFVFTYWWLWWRGHICGRARDWKIKILRKAEDLGAILQAVRISTDKLVRAWGARRAMGHR